MKVFYDQSEDGLSPVWMLLPINTLEWQLERFYVPLKAPFERFTTEDFNSNQLYITVLIEDLVRNWNERESIGISLPSIQNRFNAQKSKNDIDEEYTISDIQHLVVRMGDIEEVLQMNIQRKFKWELTSNERTCISTR